MEPDVLDELPRESRTHVVSIIQRTFGLDIDSAEDIVRSSEPFWNAMERAGGLVDSWGGGEFVTVLPRVLEFIRSGALQSE